MVIINNNVFEVLFFTVISLAAYQFLETKSEKLILEPDNELFNLWKNFPAETPIDFYFFNWTNSKNIYNPSVKPHFKEIGPYRFIQKNQKSDVVWNDNGTVSYRQLRYWYFSNKEVKSDLEDEITIASPSVLGFRHIAGSNSNYLNRALTFILDFRQASLTVKRTAREILFEGYFDPLLRMYKKFAYETEMDKFGFFYNRHGSTRLNGIFNIGTGEHNDFAKLYSWNYNNKTNFYDGEYGEIGNSAGDFFQPPLSKNKISFFVPDLCRVITLEYTRNETVFGLEGYKYTMGNYNVHSPYVNVQNGYTNRLRAGVSACEEDAPFYTTLPHFYKADPWLSSQIDVSSSDQTNHEFTMTIEPNTGILLKADVRFQANMLLEPIRSIRLFRKIPQPYMIPIMWYEYRPRITPSMAQLIKSFVIMNEI